MTNRPLPVEEYERLGVMPFQSFPESKREAIERELSGDRPPPKFRYLEMARIVNRAWFEWYVRRGRDPRKSRDKVPMRMREFVIERSGYVCGICGGHISGDIHIDHIKPVAHGGRTVMSNLQAAHPECNMSKGARWGG